MPTTVEAVDEDYRRSPFWNLLRRLNQHADDSTEHKQPDDLRLGPGRGQSDQYENRPEEPILPYRRADQFDPFCDGNAGAS